MDKKLMIQALVKYSAGFLMVGALLFIPAGSLSYWNGWLFMGLLFIPMFAVGLILFVRNPELLRKRLNAKEKESEQKEVVGFSALMFLAGFVTSGLNFRFQWIKMPPPIVIVASVLFLTAYLMYAEVMRENAYLARTIEVQENQKVIDTGLYGIVRHPMYAATVLLFLAIPLILGSLISFLIFLVYPWLIAKRIRNEEALLEKELQGYKEYRQKVRYKMIPWIW